MPDECEISIDRRYVPSETLESILEEFDQIFQDIKKKDPQFETTVQFRSFLEKSYTGYEKKVKKHHPFWITDKKNIFVQKTLSALNKVGQQPKTGYCIGGTDGSMSAGLMGIPTIIYSGMEVKYAHTPEERVNIDKMIQSLESLIKEHDLAYKYFIKGVDSDD